MKDEPSALNDRIASCVRELRAAQGLSLDTLAARSGVSRSTISLIERGETSPTAAVLEKVAGSLGIRLAALFAAAEPAPAGPLSRRDEQPLWRDPGSGYLRRQVSPPLPSLPVQIAEVTFPACARVVFDNAGRDAREHQQIWLFDGTIDVQVGEERHRLKAGDCLAMQLNQPVVFHNAAKKPARYAVVTA